EKSLVSSSSTAWQTGPEPYIISMSPTLGVLTPSGGYSTRSFRYLETSGKSTQTDKGLAASFLRMSFSEVRSFPLQMAVWHFSKETRLCIPKILKLTAGFGPCSLQCPANHSLETIFLSFTHNDIKTSGSAPHSP